MIVPFFRTWRASNTAYRLQAWLLFPSRYKIAWKPLSLCFAYHYILEDSKSLVLPSRSPRTCWESTFPSPTRVLVSERNSTRRNLKCLVKRTIGRRRFVLNRKTSANVPMLFYRSKLRFFNCLGDTEVNRLCHIG